MIIPRRHVLSICDLTDLECADISLAVKRAINTIVEKINSQGVVVLSSIGKIAGQTINHCHVHVISKNNRDGFKIAKRKKDKYLKKSKEITEGELIKLKKYFK